MMSRKQTEPTFHQKRTSEISSRRNFPTEKFISQVHSMALVYLPTFGKIWWIFVIICRYPGSQPPLDDDKTLLKEMVVRPPTHQKKRWLDFQGLEKTAEAAGGFGTWARSQLFVGPNESALAGGILVPEARRVSVSLCYWQLCDFYWVQEPRRKKHYYWHFWW